jgi:uncharacterized protein YuzE
MEEISNPHLIPIDVIDYDFENDSLLFNHQGTQYESSIDLGDIILDIGVDGLPVGLEILHASKIFNVQKSAIKNFQKFRAEILISEQTIEIKYAISMILRNHKTEKIAVSRGINDVNVPSAQIAMVC